MILKKRKKGRNDKNCIKEGRVEKKNIGTKKVK